MKTYEQRRFELLIELRLLRRTQPTRRVIKHIQQQMRKLRTMRRMMQEAET